MTTRNQKSKSRETAWVRYETRCGEGLFHVARQFVWLADSSTKPRARAVIVSKVALREILQLEDWLRQNTTPPPRGTYDDRICREPITWFRASALEHLRHADRLCELLRKEGLEILRIERKQIRGILWQDEVTAVSRRERRNASQTGESVVTTWINARRAKRRMKQAKRRQSTMNRIAREFKRGLT